MTRTYAGPPRTDALRATDLTIDGGEMVAIVGPSGSGKSTLLNLMGTLDRPTTGRVEVAGCSTAAMGDRGLSALRAASIGFVFQGDHLLEPLSTEENVALGLLYRGVPAAARRKRARETLEVLGLGHRLKHRPSQLSGGEAQRVAIARAIVGGPAVILGDEPTGNLDTEHGHQVLDTLLQLSAAGTALVLVTHNPEIAARLPRQIEVRDGRVVSDRRS